jgi:hypothetical protein
MALSLRSGETHDACYRSGNLAVTSGLFRQMPAAVGRQLIEASPSIVGRYAPFTFDPPVQFEALQSGIERAFLNLKQIVG